MTAMISRKVASLYTSWNEAVQVESVLNSTQRGLLDEIEPRDVTSDLPANITSSAIAIDSRRHGRQVASLGTTAVRQFVLDWYCEISPSAAIGIGSKIGPRTSVEAERRTNPFLRELS